VTGRRFEFPDGSLYDVIESAADSGGRRSAIQITLPPHPATPPPHIHPQQEESLLVIHGTLDVLVGREWRTLGPGETATVPAGTVHTFRNRSGQNVTFRTAHVPALAYERYIERLYWLSAMNRIRRPSNLPSLLYSSLLLDTHRQDQVLARSGARVAVRAMAQVARLLRMRVDR
jgi:quercetin dioxygenase-like cupin family protein